VPPLPTRSQTPQPSGHPENVQKQRPSRRPRHHPYLDPGELARLLEDDQEKVLAELGRNPAAGAATVVAAHMAAGIYTAAQVYEHVRSWAEEAQQLAADLVLGGWDGTLDELETIAATS